MQLPRLIGLMMIRDEEDMLAEALRNHVRFCDAILVLDGTRGAAQKTSRDLCCAFDEVAGYWTDAETGYRLPVRDGARQFLVERARERFGVNNWYAILHGDEIWGEDPRPLLDPEDSSARGIAVDSYHFFPHVSQRDTWSFDPGVSIEALAQWYMLPSIDEHRLFRDTGSHDYVVETHLRTVPPDIPCSRRSIAVKQYNYRSPEQAHRRAVARKQEGWQTNHYQHLLDGPEAFFVATLGLPGLTWAGAVPPGGGRATNVQRNPLPFLGAPARGGGSAG